MTLLRRPALPRATAALLALAWLGVSGLVSAAGRPITHEDLWTFARLSPPAVSHDGRFAAVVATQPAYDPAQQSADLWLLPTDGKGAPRQLTFSKAAEAGPVFSPDGSQLAFTVQREGDAAPQVYVLDLRQGGEPRRVTSISTGARTPQFSPDGAKLLFVSTVFPGTMNDADNVRIAAERKARKDNVRVYTGFPIRNWDRWLDDRQQRLFVVPVAGGEAKDMLATSALVKEPGFGGRFTETGEEIDATWTPDGEAVVFSATINRHRAAFANTHTDLYRVPATGGEAERLTGSGAIGAQDSYGRPQFSADGRQLVAHLTPRGEKVYQPTRLATFSWPDAKAGPTVALPAQVFPLLLAQALHSLPGAMSRESVTWREACIDAGLAPADEHWRSVEAGEDCWNTFGAAIEALGPYPHAEIAAGVKKIQQTRMLKLRCPACGYIVRTTAKWLQTGLPVCHDGTPFVAETEEAAE